MPDVLASVESFVKSLMNREGRQAFANHGRSFVFCPIAISRAREKPIERSGIGRVRERIGGRPSHPSMVARHRVDGDGFGRGADRLRSAAIVGVTA